jgi:hypothetical protein
MKLPGKHLFGDIDGKRGTIVEKGTTKERVDFLKELLEHNGFEVLVQEDKRRKEDDPVTYTIGVTDLIFNPTIWIYERKLKTPDGKIVTQDIWFQREPHAKPQYWHKKYVIKK